MTNQRQGIRIVILLSLLAIVTAATCVQRLWQSASPLDVDRTLATCDRIEVDVSVSATGQRRMLYFSRPSEIETVRRLIDARHAQPATEWQKVAHGLPGCNGHAPFIRLHAWKGPKQVADLELESSALTNKARDRGDQLLILASDSAYLRFCADCDFWAPGLEVRE